MSEFQIKMYQMEAERKWRNSGMSGIDITALIAMRENMNKLESENKRLRKALEKIADHENWGYFDESGCPKGFGTHTESWVRESHPIEIAQSALSGEGEVGA